MRQSELQSEPADNCSAKTKIIMSATFVAKGKVVVVTGAASGLGKAIAAACLAAGASVAICDVNSGRLAETAAEWEGKHDGRFLASEADVTDESAVEGFFHAAVALFGRVDMLVNNAGVMDSWDPAGTTSMATWERVVGVNLTGAFLCTKFAVQAMEAQPGSGGTVINIGSIACYKGWNGGAAYTVSKHGLLGLTRNTAAWYGEKGIYSICLQVGYMETNIHEVCRPNSPVDKISADVEG
jgi:NAD(P)-dependent dehydrogenase (short-subunit alcohol dehydrogenase family)